jgi:hypothetical protein
MLRVMRHGLKAGATATSRPSGVGFAAAFSLVAMFDARGVLTDATANYHNRYCAQDLPGRRQILVTSKNTGSRSGST